MSTRGKSAPPHTRLTGRSGSPPPLNTFAESDAGVLLFSITHDLLYMSPSASRMLQRLASTHNHVTPPDVPPVLVDLCRNMTEACQRCTSTQEWGSVQVRHLLPIDHRQLRVTGYVIPERSWPPTYRLLFILERLATEPPVASPISIPDLLLTARQEAVVRGLLRGLTNKELAKELVLSTHTVKDYVRLIMAKLQTTTRAGIVSRLLTGPSVGATGKPTGRPTERRNDQQRSPRS